MFTSTLYLSLIPPPDTHTPCTIHQRKVYTQGVTEPPLHFSLPLQDLLIPFVLNSRTLLMFLPHHTLLFTPPPPPPLPPMLSPSVSLPFQTHPHYTLTHSSHWSPISTPHPLVLYPQHTTPLIPTYYPTLANLLLKFPNGDANVIKFT